MAEWYEFCEAGNCGVLDLGRLVARLSAVFVFCLEIHVESHFGVNLGSPWFGSVTGRPKFDILPRGGTKQPADGLGGFHMCKPQQHKGFQDPWSPGCSCSYADRRGAIPDTIRVS